jgi:hypothetical protein
MTKPAIDISDLDERDTDTLMAFWFRYQSGRHYRELFPDGGKGSKRATADLANYASNQGVAKSCRLRGDVNTALMYESIAERIYANLPSFAQF